MIGKPKEFTDAEAEAFIRYLTQEGEEKEKKKRKKRLVEAFLETKVGANLYKEWLRKEKWRKRAR